MTALCRAHAALRLVTCGTCFATRPPGIVGAVVTTDGHLLAFAIDALKGWL